MDLLRNFGIIIYFYTIDHDYGLPICGISQDYHHLSMESIAQLLGPLYLMLHPDITGSPHSLNNQNINRMLHRKLIDYNIKYKTSALSPSVTIL